MCESNIKYNLYNNVCGDSIWIGIDDTDSRNGGCTTFLARQVIEALNTAGFAVIGYPRLVRLNPNIPWKTRGNGAISIQVGWLVDQDPLFFGGTSDGSFKALGSLPRPVSKKDMEKLRVIVASGIDRYARFEDDTTNPGAVILSKPPSVEVYYRTVTEVVRLDEIQEVLERLDAVVLAYKNARGLIGATASVAWQPIHDCTYELIAYRYSDRWGSERVIDANSVQRLDAEVSQSFDNYDYINHHNRIAPRSPCPVLYGVRGDTASELVKSLAIVSSEPWESWVIFQTNQATDDHVFKRTTGSVQRYQSAIITGEVAQIPQTLPGGHVIFSLKDEEGSISCAAYEPTKEFRQVIRQLLPGDQVTVYGGVRVSPLTINLEKIYIRSLVSPIVKLENPVCPSCGKHMKSAGHDQGYRCRRCKTMSNEPRRSAVQRDLSVGWYEVPVCARRHLSKPLKRMGVRKK
ncbi:MAG: tRNA(Ile)(2)-agmatinylcytidine synthase [Candidatus Thermoplasmatota archaeon]|nr:tRNA(Ile)(2)-agmatinylcytidine synthase [Candidatus Thermoplasmatota archaeon]